MNSQRRHELQNNELADFLGRFLKKAEPYAPVAVTAVIAVIVVVLGVTYFQSRAATQRSDATLLYLLNAGQADPAALGDIVANFPEAGAARLAQLAQADAYLGQGIEALFTDRELANGWLEDAVATYDRVLAEASEPIVLSRAHLGKARAQESLGRVDDAIASYEQVIDLQESEAMVEVIEQRIARLQDPESQAFLAWFQKQQPQQADPSLPPDLPDASGLPGMPDLNLPDFSNASGQVPDGGDSEVEGAAETSDSMPAEATAPSGNEEDTPAPTAPEAEPKTSGAPASEAAEEDAAPADSPDEADAPTETDAPSEADAPSETDAPSEAADASGEGSEALNAPANDAGDSETPSAAAAGAK